MSISSESNTANAAGNEPGDVRVDAPRVARLMNQGSSRKKRQITLIVSAVLALCLLLVPVLFPGFSGKGQLSNATSEPVKAYEIMPEQPFHTWIIAVTGLKWSDISETETPALYCLAQETGIAALALTSGSVLTTQRQALASLETGQRTAPLTTSENYTGVPISELASFQGVHVYEAEPIVEGEGREASVAKLEEELANFATCESLQLIKADPTYDGPNRIIIAGLGQVDPGVTEIRTLENERNPANLPAQPALLVYMDSGFESSLLTSGSTRQPGLLTNLDIAASIRGVEQFGNGREILGIPAASEEAKVANFNQVRDFSTDASTVEQLLPRYLLLLAGAMVVVLLGQALVRGLLLTGRAETTGYRVLQLVMDFLSVTVLLVPAFGLVARIFPVQSLISNGAEPALAYSLPIVCLAALTAICLLALSHSLRELYSGAFANVPRALPMAFAGFGFILVLVLDLVLGSHAQLGSFLGTSPIYGSRFYGLNNQLAGMLLVYWLLSLAALFLAIRLRRRYQVALVLLSGATLALFAIAPGVGADVGSALIFAPATLIAALILTGIRWRWWHLLVALLSGITLLALAGYLDYLRPVTERTHLGMLVASLLGEGELPPGVDAAANQAANTTLGEALLQLWNLAIDRLINMLEPLWIYPLWFVLAGFLLLLVGLYFALHRARVFNQMRVLYVLRAVGIFAAALGALTNDTGLVLLAVTVVLGSFYSALIWLIRE